MLSGVVFLTIARWDCTVCLTKLSGILYLTHMWDCNVQYLTMLFAQWDCIPDHYARLDCLLDHYAKQELYTWPVCQVGIKYLTTMLGGTDYLTTMIVGIVQYA
jgi:hypothetical protein